MGGVDPLARKREGAARRAIDGRELLGKQLARGLRERLPDQEGARILLGRGDRRREQRQQRGDALVRIATAPPGAQRTGDLPRRPADRGRDDDGR